jgi:hypothetical protein
MTDVQALYEYRLNQSRTTFVDAELMLKQSVSPRSIINRAYYCVLGINKRIEMLNALSSFN